jgi:uncharacterized protein YdhG (YjbR/CyaY superfamily)
MAKTDFKNVGEYLATLSEHDRDVVQAICNAIQEAVPEAEEVISYQLPAYKYHGWIFYVSAATNHYAISCPPPFAAFSAFKSELAPYEISKSAVKFPKSAPVPLALIADMSRYQAQQNLQRAAAKKPKK